EVVSMVEAGERLDTTERPGARRSGLATPSLVGPLLENDESLSSLAATVVLSLLEPTVITNGSLPGVVTVPGWLPPLPAAATTTIPAFHTRSTAKSRGSTLEDWCESNPSDMFTTRMPYSCWKVTTHSSASSTIVTSVDPVRPAI